jgi:hypothetical protein
MTLFRSLDRLHPNFNFMSFKPSQERYVFPTLVLEICHDQKKEKYPDECLRTSVRMIDRMNLKRPLMPDGPDP